MNIISFASTRPYDVYKWATEYFLERGISKNDIQLTHPNVRYNEQAKIIICWFIEALQKDIMLLDKEDIFIILMDNRKTELEKCKMPIADTTTIDNTSFTSIISDKYLNLE